MGDGREEETRLPPCTLMIGLPVLVMDMSFSPLLLEAKLSCRAFDAFRAARNS